MAAEWEADKRALEEELSAALALAQQELVRARASAAHAKEASAALAAAHAAASARAEELQAACTSGDSEAARWALHCAEQAAANLAQARPHSLAAFAACPPPHFREDFRGSYTVAIHLPAGATLDWKVGRENSFPMPKSCSFEDTEYDCSMFVAEVTPGGNVEAVGVRAGDQLGLESKNPREERWGAEAPNTFAIIKLERR